MQQHDNNLLNHWVLPALGIIAIAAVYFILFQDAFFR